MYINWKVNTSYHCIYIVLCFRMYTIYKYMKTIFSDFFFLLMIIYYKSGVVTLMIFS